MLVPQATAAVERIPHHLDRSDDEASQAHLAAFGEALDVIPVLAPQTLRPQLREAASAFERATRPRIRAEHHHARALRGAVRAMIREPAPRDGAVLAMFLDAAILVVIAAARWHQLHHYDQQVAAAHQTLLRLQAAYDQAAATPLAALAQRRPPQQTVDRHIRHLCQAVPEHAEQVIEDPAFDALATAAYARQYWHPVSYLPALRNVDHLLFGDPAAADAVPDEDAHLDRELDIVFSGDVFTATCREPFLDVCLPLFDEPDLDRQPALVVDSGCGDGTLLYTLHTAIRDRTARGRRLADRPLLMVGVEPSPVARHITAERLARAGIPHLVIDGDITDPDRMARQLAGYGLDAADALHVSKSVIHDRNFRAGRPRSLPDTARPPRMLRFFVDSDGQAITPDAMARDLAAHFHSWRALARRHGLVVIEAHAPDAMRAAMLNGTTLATDLDATHGYSRQYPVEPQVFAWAAEVAGFRSVRHHDLGTANSGHTMLTIDHFTTREER